MASQRARYLRKHQTDAERKLWSVLRRHQADGHRFRRQHPVGPYVADFICLAEKLIVEVDGSQHAHNEAADAERAAWLQSRGYRVIRFWNNEVFINIEGVYDTIRLSLHGGQTRK